MHEAGLIWTIAASLSVALVLGFISQRLGASPILGYLIAGIAVGPHTPGFVANAPLAAQLAEVGVVLLMFGVGLHFNFKDLLAVRSIAVPGAIGQSLVATACATIAAMAFGWGIGAGLVMGIAVSVASTVVLIRGLTDADLLDTPQGHIAIGWLVVEDIFTVLVLVLLPPLAESFANGGEPGLEILEILGLTVLKLGLLGMLMLGAGKRVIPWLLQQVARSRSRELFTLAVLAIALAIATGSALIFGASMALGAFLAGMVVGQSPVSHQAAADALPMRDAFAVLFFVSVGMLFDPAFLVARPELVLMYLGIVLLAKPLAALLIVTLLGYSVKTALTVAVGLAQIGEFSFILADVARASGLLPEEGSSVLVACAMLSIALNPFLFRSMAAFEDWIRGRPALWSLLSRRAESRGRAANLATVKLLADGTSDTGKIHAIVAGYGPVGRTVARLLRDFGIEPVIIDLNVDTVGELVREGRPAVYGDARRSDILSAAGIARASYLVVTPPHPESRIPVITMARDINPDIRIFVRARYLSERAELEGFGATGACYEEAEAAVALARLLLEEVGATEERIKEETARIHAELAIRTAFPAAMPRSGTPPSHDLTRGGPKA